MIIIFSCRKLLSTRYYIFIKALHSPIIFAQKLVIQCIDIQYKTCCNYIFELERFTIFETDQCDVHCFRRKCLWLRTLSTILLLRKKLFYK